MASPREPRSREEWQLAVDAAWACLSLEDARQYGLVTGGPTVDAARCRQILDEGWRTHRVRARPDATERLIRELMAERV